MQVADFFLKWNTHTFAAWCRRGGCQSNKRQGFISWNTELLKPVVSALVDLWKQFDLALRECHKKHVDLLTASLDSIGENLKGK